MKGRQRRVGQKDLSEIRRELKQNDLLSADTLSLAPANFTTILGPLLLSAVRRVRVPVHIPSIYLGDRTVTKKKKKIGIEFIYKH